MIKLFYSNRIENLYQNLKKNLFARPTPPFARRLIIVPTPAIKSWLLLQLAKDPELGIAAGLEILYLDDSLKNLQNAMFHKKEQAHVPNLLELTLTIDGTIRKIAVQNEMTGLWKPLLDYLKISNPKLLSKRSEKRLAHLSETLAKLFINYGKYGQSMIESWKNSSEGWQQALWCQIFSNNNWSYPSKNYPFLNVNALPQNLQIHLFSISFLSKSECCFFEKIGEVFPVHYYSLSPCHLFWSDSLSDKEEARLQQYWNQRGVSTEEQKLLEDYVQDKNPLLANWGKLGRKMAELFENKEYETFSHYFLPKNIHENRFYQDYIDQNIACENSDLPPTLLDYLQADILLMRNPQKKEETKDFHNEKIVIKNDQSVQLHYAPNKQREVQILYHHLLSLIQREKNLEPSDIIVLAPDIMDYAPYIRQIFGSEESQLDFQLMDMKTLSEDSLIKQFWYLMELPFGRWNAQNLMTLFSFPGFQQRHQISTEDVAQINEWIEKASIHWGKDSAHRNDILQERYDENMIEETLIGTWEGGFSKLLLGLAMQNTSDIITVDPTQGLLLGKWMTLIRSLKNDLKVFAHSTQKTYCEWMTEIKHLITTYLSNKTSNDEEQENLLSCLDEFAQASRWIEEQKVSFISLKEHLKSFLGSQTLIYHENHLQAIRFCSMLPMRTIPSRVIALMGMNETAFPRSDIRLSLNLMQDHHLCSYCPTRTDYDRYLFLESLLSARQYLILSYSHDISESNQSREQAPSLLITELMSYINTAYELTESLIHIHPYRTFDAKYFSNNPVYKNYSLSDYRTAMAYYQNHKLPKHRFISDFKPQSNQDPAIKTLIIDIKQIKTALQNPLKHYFNASGIYLKGEENELQIEETFVTNPLQIYDFKKSSLKQDWNVSIQLAEKQGKMPFGLLKKTAMQIIQNDINKYHATLSKMGVDLKNIFEIHLNEQYEQPFHDSTGWKLPPVQVKYRDQIIHIVGTLSEVSNAGLIIYMKGDKSDLTKGWAEFILLTHLIDLYQLPIQKKLLCAKSGYVKNSYSQNPLQILEQILDYYFYSLKNASPLISDWTHAIAYQESGALQNTLDKSLKDSFNPLRNPYVQWTCQQEAPNAANLIEHWQSQAHQLFSPLYQAWIAKDE